MPAGGTIPPRAKALLRARVEENARKKGLSRRQFLASACGMATALLALNELTGCAGGRFALPREAALDDDLAKEALLGDELVFDAETHHASPARDFLRYNPTVAFLAETPQARCGEPAWVACYSRDHYLRAIFLESDTHMAHLSAPCGGPLSSPLHIEEAARTREVMDKLDDAPRLFLSGAVMPRLQREEAQRERMQALVEEWGVVAFQLHPAWGPFGEGYFLDHPDFGLATIQNARRVGLKTLFVDKGQPLAGMDPTYARCRDVGVVAKLFPDVRFVVGNAGHTPGVKEGPFDPSAERGIDELIRSLEEHGVGPNENVYVTLGSAWRALLSRPDEAAHALGKLLRFIGEDNVLWGTGAIYYGSPQAEIAAFRAFSLSLELCERHGYPPLSRARKEKILGRNAARLFGIDVEEAKAACALDGVARAKGRYLAAKRR